MSRPSLPWLLATRLWLMRLGLANSVAGLLCIAGAAAWIYGVPLLHRRLQEQQRQLPERLARIRAQAVQPAAEPAQPDSGLAAFRGMLGEGRFTEQQLKAMFAMARDNGLQLDRAQYKSATDSSGQFQTYQIILPVKAAYGPLRQFSEQMLASIPFAALDAMTLRRDSISQPILDAQLRFTLFLASPAPSSGEPDAGAGEMPKAGR